MPDHNTEKNRQLEAPQPQSNRATQEPDAEAVPGFTQTTEEPNAEERARRLIRKHEQAYRQRIEDAKARIKMRREWRRTKRMGRAYTYTVQPGDTLEVIAQTFYAKPEHWPEIYEANAERILDPEALEPGTELIIL